MTTSNVRRLHDQRNIAITALTNDWEAGNIPTHDYARRVSEILASHAASFDELLKSQTVVFPPEIARLVANLKAAMALPKSPQADYAIQVNKDLISEKMIEILLSK